MGRAPMGQPPGSVSAAAPVLARSAPRKRLEARMEPASAALAQSGLEISARKLAEYVAPVINLCITTPLNFFINKFWTYRQKRKTTEG